MNPPETKRLRDVASVIRSKNAGPFELTFDVMFEDPEAYERVKASVSDGLDIEKEVTRRAGISVYPRFSTALSPQYITPVNLATPQLSWASDWELDGEGDRERGGDDRGCVSARHGDLPFFGGSLNGRRS